MEKDVKMSVFMPIYKFGKWIKSNKEEKEEYKNQIVVLQDTIKEYQRRISNLSQDIYVR